MALDLTLFSASHIGNRQENQDSFTYFADPQAGQYWLVVADGMGGHAGGALAAQAVTKTARSCWAKRNEFTDAEAFLSDFIVNAQTAVRNAGLSSTDDPRSTVAAMLISGKQATSVHVGDTRVIQQSHSGKLKRTIDHSIAQLRVLEGKISDAEMATHPDQNKLTNCLGDEEHPDPEFESWDLTAPTTFIVCSDGFWELFDPDQMFEPVSMVASDRQLYDLIDSQINQRSSHDNSTAIVATIGAGAASKRQIMPLIAVGLAAIVLATVGIIMLFTSGGGKVESSDSELEPDMVDQIPSEASSEPPPFEGEVTNQEEDSPILTEGGSGPVYSLPDIPTQTKEDLAIEVNEGGDGTAEIEDFLKEDGQLGEYDQLESTKPQVTVGSDRIVSLQQTYKGVPVVGAEIRGTITGGLVSRVSGKPVADIDISVEPELSFPEALATAAGALEEELSADGDGLLVIFPTNLGYRLSWQAIVNAGIEQFIMVIAADDGEVLAREPVMQGEDRISAAIRVKDDEQH